MRKGGALLWRRRRKREGSVCGGGLGRFGLPVSMVISLCVLWGDNRIEVLKVIVEGGVYFV